MRLRLSASIPTYPDRSWPSVIGVASCIWVHALEWRLEFSGKNHKLLIILVPATESYSATKPTQIERRMPPWSRALSIG